MAPCRLLAIVGGGLAAVVSAGCKDSHSPPASITVTAVSPASGPLAGGTNVTITGSNFANVTSVTIGGNELGSRTVVTATQITGTTLAASELGASDVVVSSSSNGNGTCKGCFRYLIPVLGRPLAAGLEHTCALTSGGAAYCWGRNDAGQLGDGSTTTSSSIPVAVSGGLTFRAIAAGGLHTCVLTTVGEAYCWGLNSLGQLGIESGTGPETCPQGSSPPRGSFDCSTLPIRVATARHWSDLAAGLVHTCGWTPVGQGYCWGDDFLGELGDGSTGTASSTPVAVSGALTFSAIAPGRDHTCGVTIGGAPFCWGYNHTGQLGDESTTSSATPVAVSGGLSFSAVATGANHSCGITSAGAVYCWGYNGSGQLGDGTTTQRLVPTAVAFP